jgi:hypothetical protein
VRARPTHARAGIKVAGRIEFDAMAGYYPLGRFPEKTLSALEQLPAKM